MGAGRGQYWDIVGTQYIFREVNCVGKRTERRKWSHMGQLFGGHFTLPTHGSHCELISIWELETVITSWSSSQ